MPKVYLIEQGNPRREGTELGTEFRIQHIRRRVFGIHTYRLEAELRHQINGHALLVDVVALFLYLLATQCVTGLQTSVCVEVDDRPDAENHFPTPMTD